MKSTMSKMLNPQHCNNWKFSLVCIYVNTHSLDVIHMHKCFVVSLAKHKAKQTRFLVSHEPISKFRCGQAVIFIIHHSALALLRDDQKLICNARGKKGCGHRHQSQ